MLLWSSDGKFVQLPTKVWRSSEFLRELPISLLSDGPTPVDSVDHATLKQIIQWHRLHVQDDLSLSEEIDSDSLQQWEQSFSPDCYTNLLNLTTAANFLDFSAMLEYCCKRIAKLVNEGSLHSLEGLPDELTLQVAESLSTYWLQDFARKCLVPVTSKSKSRYQHAYAWAKALGEVHLTYLETSLHPGSNAFLMGPGAKVLYESAFETNPTTSATSYAFLSWIGNGPKVKPKVYSSYYGHTSELKSPSVIIQLKQTFGSVPVPDIGNLVDSRTLKAHIIYMKDPEFALHEVQLEHSGESPAETYYMGRMPEHLFPLSYSRGLGAFIQLSHRCELSEEEGPFMTGSEPAMERP